MLTPYSSLREPYRPDAGEWPLALETHNLLPDARWTTRPDIYRGPSAARRLSHVRRGGLSNVWWSVDG